MSKLLIKEPPLQVLPSLAVAIGLNEAIIVQQLHYWLENKSVGVERDGFKWVFNTYEEWQENFPFWSVPTIQRAFLSLEKSGVVISAQLDAKKHDQKKFYRIDYAVLDAMDDIKLMQSKTSKRDDVKRTTETTPEIKKDDDEGKNLQENSLARLTKLYESNIGIITPLMSDTIKEIDENYPAEWHLPAIKVCVDQNKRTAAYLLGVLKKWKEKGFGWKPEMEKRQNGYNQRPSPQGSKPITEPSDADIETARLILAMQAA